MDNARDWKEIFREVTRQVLTGIALFLFLIFWAQPTKTKKKWKTFLCLAPVGFPLIRGQDDP